MRFAAPLSVVWDLIHVTTVGASLQLPTRRHLSIAGGSRVGSGWLPEESGESRLFLYVRHFVLHDLQIG